MNSYTVHKILQVGSRQLLLVRPNDYDCSLAVYDEHTGTTLMRMTTCTISEFKRAIALLESQSTDPNQS
jgi:hypothetical protein